MQGSTVGAVGDLPLAFHLADLLVIPSSYRMRRPSSLWAFIFYAWATVLVYNSFRNTTFFLLLLFLYRFLPVMLAVKVLSALCAKLPRASSRSLS